MRKAFNILTTVLLVLVLVFAFLLVGMKLFGLSPYTVLSGSMEPEYHVGSLIYVKKTSAEELTVGVPITYTISGGTVVTHRIVEVIEDENDPGNLKYRVKGDANEDADGDPVHISKVIGRPVFTIPFLGYVCFFIQNPPGSFITVGFLVLFVILGFIPDIIAIIKAEEAEKKVRSDSEIDRLNEELKRLKAELNKKDGVSDTSIEEEKGADDSLTENGNSL